VAAQGLFPRLPKARRARGEAGAGAAAGIESLFEAVCGGNCAKVMANVRLVADVSASRWWMAVVPFLLGVLGGFEEDVFPVMT